MAKSENGFSWGKPSAPKTSGVDLTERIQKKAQEIWERKGRPQGQDVQNWLEAEKLVKSGRA